MLSVNLKNKLFTIENNAVSISADFNCGLKILNCSNLFSNVISNKNRELFSLNFKSKDYTSKDFEITKVLSASDNVHELITVLLTNENLGISLRIHFLSDKKETIEIIFQIKDSFKDGLAHKMTFHSPFLAYFEFCGDDIYYYPAAALKNALGKPLIKPVSETFAASDLKLPLTVVSKKNTFGFAVDFPFLSDMYDGGSAQNRDVFFTAIKNRDELKNNSVLLSADNSFNDSAIFKITGLKDGWVEAFSRTRDKIKSNYSLEEYKRKDLKWFEKCAVQNFTFLYGDLGFDGEKTDTEKIISEGKDYGGYDCVTLWNQYPRLGIDSRSQWDFYDDFPGGRDELKNAIEKLHKADIKVFLPFIPWDTKSNLSMDEQAEKLSQLINYVGADGIQFDTLDNIPVIFQKKVCKVGNGIVLTSQMHPKKGQPLETITSSWDEMFYSGFMPQTDILRFIFPEHTSPAVSRWSRYEDKNELIDYAVFTAEPILIWTDVFGRYLPFSKGQKAKIKEWKRVYLENFEIYRGKEPIPLIPCEEQFVFCNLFRSADKKAEIYSIYNDSEKAFSGRVLKLINKNAKNIETVFGNSEAKLENGFVTANIPPHETIHFKVF